MDRNSRPHKTRSTIDEERHARIERLRRERMPMRRTGFANASAISRCNYAC